MALVNRIFYSCAFGLSVTKTFQIDTAGTWVSNQSSVIYSGDGACYVYTNGSSISSPKQSYATEEYSNCAACRTANPDNLYYTFWLRYRMLELYFMNPRIPSIRQIKLFLGI